MENENVNEQELLESFVSQLGGTMPTETPAETDSQPEETHEEPENAQPEETTEEPEEQPAKEENPAPETQDQNSRAAQAFVYMRQQNKTMRDMLNNVAGVLGIENIDPNNEQQLMDALKARVTEDQAKKNNVPTELMQRLNDLEQRDRAYTAAERQRTAVIGLQRVKDNFKLKDAELTQFANDLIKAGKNPLEGELDLVSEYKMMHFDDIVQAEVSAAVAAEQARAAKANQQSSTPGNTTSGPNNDTEVGKINSIRALENWGKTQG